MFITSRPIYSKEIAISSYNITLFHNKQKRKNEEKKFLEP